MRDKPYLGVRQQWIICHLPFARDWKIESIHTNLRTYRVVLSHGTENLEIDDAWVDWWLKVSTHARTQDELDRAAARHGYVRVTPGSALH